jgi:sugar lactone lactonase YvrE
LTFTVEYADNTAVDVSSLDSSDIRVTGPNNFSQLATFLSVTSGGNGTPRTATYQINAPGGSWDAADNGTYTLGLAASQVLDTSGNAASAVNLGNFNVSAPALDAAVTLAVSPSGAIEDSGSAIAYTFTRTDSVNSPLSQPLTVSFSVGGTASFTNDYTQSGAATFSAATGTVSFPANSATSTVQLTPIADVANEPNETIELTVTAGTGYTSATAGAVTATITNDDIPPTYNFSAATFNVPEGNAANTTNVVTVTRSGDTSAASSVNVVLAAGAANPATIGSDLQSVPITVNFAAGETSKTVPIQVLGDITYEPDETVALSFANFTNGGVAGTVNPTAVLTIQNDDAEIRGSKWNDLNGNGLRDTGEVGIAGWTVFLDTNQNGVLDAGETSTTTDASGNYAFPGLPAGSYTVAEQLQAGWQQTFPGITAGAATNFLIPLPTRRDHVFDRTRDRLYITTNKGTVERYDFRANAWLAPLKVGNSLNGVDITPDGSALYVAENQRSGVQGFLRKVNLNTGAVTNLPYNLQIIESGSWDVAIGANGKGMMSTRWEGSGTVPFREINLATDTLTQRSDAGSTFGKINQNTHIHRSSDRSLFFMTEPNSSAGPIFTYNGTTDTFPNRSQTNTFHDGTLSAVSRNGALIALEEFGVGISIRNPNLTQITTLNNNFDGGLAFDPTKDILYAVNSTTDQIIAFNTNTWTQLFSLNIGENVPSSTPFDSGVMSVSNDGKLLFLSTPSGVRILSLPGSNIPQAQTVNLAANQLAENVNFGNRQTAQLNEIRGTKWNDLNRDRALTAGEPGIAGWTVFLDTNQNGVLDAGETSTTTDASGNYAFVGLAGPRTYTVAEVLQPGSQQTFPGISGAPPSVLIPVANGRDRVFDPTRNLLYITTSAGTVQRYDVATQTLLAPLAVGTSLNGADITPDGSALYVAENQISGTQGLIRKVNLATGTVTNIPYTLDFGEAGAWDVAIGSNGRGMVSTRNSGSGTVPFREINLATDTLTQRSDAGSTFGKVNQDTHIHRSSDRTFFFMTESNSSAGEIFTYDAVTNTFPTRNATDSYHGGTLSAVSRNGSLIAMELNGGISVMDRNFNAVENLAGLDGGLAFDPTKDILYAANSATDELIAYNTNTWDVLYRRSIGENINASSPFVTGGMSVSDGGQYLFLSTPSGVRMFNLTGTGLPESHKVNVGFGQIQPGINFGNAI